MECYNKPDDLEIKFCSGFAGGSHAHSCVYNSAAATLSRTLGEDRNFVITVSQDVIPKIEKGQAAKYIKPECGLGGKFSQEAAGIVIAPSSSQDLVAVAQVLFAGYGYSHSSRRPPSGNWELTASLCSKNKVVRLDGPSSTGKLPPIVLPEHEQAKYYFKQNIPTGELREKILGPDMSNIRYLTREAGMIVSFRGRGSGFLEGNSGKESCEPPHLYVKFMNNNKKKIGEELLSSLLNSVEQYFELKLPSSNIEAPLILPKSTLGLSIRPQLQLLPLPYVPQQNVATLTQNLFQPNLQQSQRMQFQSVSQENLLQALISSSQYVSQANQQIPTTPTVISQLETLIQPLIMILSQQNWQEKIPPTLFATLLDSIQPLISMLSNPNVQERMPPAQKASLKNIIQPLTSVLTNPKWQQQLSTTQLETLKNFIQCLVAIGLYPTAKQPQLASTQEAPLINKLKNFMSPPQSQAQITPLQNSMKPLTSVQSLISPHNPQVPSTQYETLINLLQSLQTPQKPSNTFEALVDQLESIIAERSRQKMQQSQNQNESATLKNLLQNLITQQSQPSSQQLQIPMTPSASSSNQIGSILPDISQLNLPKSNSSYTQISIQQNLQEFKLSPNKALLEHNFKCPSNLYSQLPQGSQIQYPLSQQNLERTKIPVMNYEANKLKESSIQCPPPPTYTTQQWKGFIQNSEKQLGEKAKHLIGAEHQFAHPEPSSTASENAEWIASNRQGKKRKYGYDDRQEEKQKYGYDEGHEAKRKYGSDDGQEEKQKYGFNAQQQLFLRRHQVGAIIPSSSRNEEQLHNKIAAAAAVTPRSGNEHTHNQNKVLTKWGPIKIPDGNKYRQIQINVKHKVKPRVGNDDRKIRNNLATAKGAVKKHIDSGQQIDNKVATTGQTTAPVVINNQKVQNKVATSTGQVSSSVAKGAVKKHIDSGQQIDNKVATTGQTTAPVVINNQKVQNKVATSTGQVSSSVDNDQQIKNENTTSYNSTLDKATMLSDLQPNPPTIPPLMSLRPDLSVFYKASQPKFHPSWMEGESILGEPPRDLWLAYSPALGMPIHPNHCIPMPPIYHCQISKMSLTGKDTLWDAKVRNKSWADHDEECARLSRNSANQLQQPNITLNSAVGLHLKRDHQKSIQSHNRLSRISNKMKPSKVYNFTANEERGDMATLPTMASSTMDINNGLIIKSKLADVMGKIPKSCVDEDVMQEVQSPSNFMTSCANMLKSFPANGITTIHGINSLSKENLRKEIKNERSKTIYRDDTSLSSYSDLFRLDRSFASEGGESWKRSMLNSSKGRNSGLATSKVEQDIKVAVHKVTQFAILQDKDTTIPDTMLMPSSCEFQSDDLIIPNASKLAGRETPKQEKEDNCQNRCRKHTPASERKRVWETILTRRQKQIDYGKNTIGYQRYRQQVPVNKRDWRDPDTPPKHAKYSRRAWDGLVKSWRRCLHFWDPPSEGGGDDCETLKVESEVEPS